MLQISNAIKNTQKVFNRIVCYANNTWKFDSEIK
jgi:hypothetical protein